MEAAGLLFREDRRGWFGLLVCPLDQSMAGLMAEKFGIVDYRTQINMRPAALLDFPAKAIEVAVGTQSLCPSRTILDRFNEVVALDQEFWRHDAIEICVSAAGRLEIEAIA